MKNSDGILWKCWEFLRWLGISSSLDNEVEIKEAKGLKNRERDRNRHETLQISRHLKRICVSLSTSTPLTDMKPSRAPSLSLSFTRPSLFSESTAGFSQLPNPGRYICMQMQQPNGFCAADAVVESEVGADYPVQQEVRKI
jgi:hypothetical protein